MAKMRAVDAAMYVLEKEGITTAFGVPGAAINPFYSAMRKHGGIRHILARHVEGASHMAEGYTRATALIFAILFLPLFIGKFFQLSNFVKKTRSAERDATDIMDVLSVPTPC